MEATAEAATAVVTGAGMVAGRVAEMVVETAGVVMVAAMVGATAEVARAGEEKVAASGVAREADEKVAAMAVAAMEAATAAVAT